MTDQPSSHAAYSRWLAWYNDDPNYQPSDGVAPAEWPGRYGDETMAEYIARCDVRSLIAEVDRLAEALAAAEAKVASLVSALERTEANFRAAVNGRTVRDMSENLAENRAALAGKGAADPCPCRRADGRHYIGCPVGDPLITSVSAAGCDGRCRVDPGPSGAQTPVVRDIDPERRLHSEGAADKRGCCNLHTDSCGEEDVCCEHCPSVEAAAQTWQGWGDTPKEEKPNTAGEGAVTRGGFKRSQESASCSSSGVDR